MAYEPPSGYKVGLTFVNGYVVPAGYKVGLEFSPSDKPVGDNQYLFPVAVDPADAGTPTVRNQYRNLAPAGFFSGSYGRPSVYNQDHYANPAGFDALGFGRPNLVNTRRPLSPQGIKSDLYGSPLVYNLLQRVTSKGFASSLLGKPYVQGGVKYLLGRGFDSAAIGRASLINTTANQTARPAGIVPPAVGSATVSPRSLRPVSIFSQLFGTPFIQRQPSPKGWQSSGFGYPVIDYKTKQIGAQGFDSLEFFYPAVFDPTQVVLASSIVRSAVFGDTAIRNTRLIIKVDGILSFESSAWTDLKNRDRYVSLAGIDSAQAGFASIANKTPNLTPVGFDALAPASTVTNIGYRIRHVEPRGFGYTGIGNALVTKTPSISPVGFSGAAGVPTIWPRIRTIEAKGKNQELFGDEANVWFRYRKYKMEGFHVSVLGNPKLEHEHRTLWLLGASHSLYGKPTLTFSKRTIEPLSVWKEFATNHMVGGLRYLQPVGFVATGWGARIIPERQSVATLGFSSAAGWPQVRNRTTEVLPKGITTTEQPADQWGRAKLYNLRQYVELTYDSGSDLEAPEWPLWTLIENRNKYLGVTGNVMSKYGRLQIDNKATPILPVGIRHPEWPIGYKAGLVAFRIRPLKLDGLEPPYISSWSRIYNDAFVASPLGFNAELFGIASLHNNRRYFKFTGWNGAAYGYPMVADAIRTISIESRYGINPPKIELPKIDLYTRYIDHIGHDSFKQGWHSLSIHFTFIKPGWTHRELCGEPRLHNVTPEVMTRGRSSEEFGDPVVRLEWRKVSPMETFTQIIPKPDIAFRDRAVSVTGINSMHIGGGTKVINTGAPPYSPQWIDLSKYESSGGYIEKGHGIGVEINQVPKPSLNQQVVYHRSGSVATLFGTTVVTANSIRVEPGIQQYTMGIAFVSLKNRDVFVGPFSDQEVFEPSKPRLSPHTIYAVKEAPLQAKDNHPVVNLHYVGETANHHAGTVIGRPSVSLYKNDLNAWGFYAFIGSRPTIFNRRSYIFTNGLHSLRVGWHKLPSTEYAGQIESKDSMIFGRPTVSRPPYIGPITVVGKGLLATVFGANNVQNKHRELNPKGFMASAVGTRKAGDSAYMWQGLRVGELMPTIPEGFDSNSFGDESWVSFRVREVHPEGYDAFACEYDLTNFSKRMKVSRVKVPVVAEHIGPEGFDAFDSGTLDIKPLAHFIRPDGNSDQYRKGAF